MNALKAVPLASIASMAIVASASCDLFHELLGHGGATLLPLGVDAIAVSTIGLTTSASNPIVAASGPAINLMLASTLVLATWRSISPSWRFFWWLFGTFNVLNATAYLLYSAALGSGDVAVALDAIWVPRIWRPAAGLAGVLAYAAAIVASAGCLRRLVVDGAVSARNVGRYASTAYWTGAILLTCGSIPNPVSPWLILTSGAATGFGAMAGLLAMPVLVSKQEGRATESLVIPTAWLAAAAVVAIVFVGVFGPGIRLRD